MWWNQRRPEIVEDFDREVLGRVPKNVPKVTWTVTNTVKRWSGSHAVIGKQLVGHVDNSADPDINVDIQMTLVTPADAKGPVPVMIMFGGGRPARRCPFRRRSRRPMPAQVRRASGSADPPSTEQLIADGWGYASLNPGSMQADNGAGLTKGIIGLVNKGQPRKPDDWGALRAWAWGASRGLDYLETDQRRRCQARWHRRRLALWQSRAGHHGLRHALRHGAGGVFGRGRRETASPQLGRSRREPDRHRANITGWPAIS